MPARRGASVTRMFTVFRVGGSGAHQDGVEPPCHPGRTVRQEPVTLSRLTGLFPFVLGMHRDRCERSGNDGWNADRFRATTPSDSEVRLARRRRLASQGTQHGEIHGDIDTDTRALLSPSPPQRRSCGGERRRLYAVAPCRARMVIDADTGDNCVSGCCPPAVPPRTRLMPSR